MLESLLEDSVDKSDCENNPLFSTEFDYDAIKKQSQENLESWANLSKEEQTTHGNYKKFSKQIGAEDPKDPKFIKSKNYSILKNEVIKRTESSNFLEILPIDELHFESSLLELMENMENTNRIKELYKLRKLTTGECRNSGISSEEAEKIKNCLRQGRELYLSGKNGSLMVKPLNYFYSITAYSYAAIILNNPIRFALGSLPGSHGINFLPADMKIQFGGDMPHGTFSELFASFPTNFIKNKNFEVVQDNIDSILNFYKIKNTVSMGTMLSLIPEIREYYKLITGKYSRTHPLVIVPGRDRMSNIWEFQIGDGEVRVPDEEINNAFPGFDIKETHGKYVVSVPAVDSHKINACITVDSRGDFWFIENPFYPVILPEICMHFILTNVFSNIMRYSPDSWGGILLNEVNSDVSLMVRKYLSAFENKFPILLLRSVSKYYPYIEKA
ncbi:YaaC family protein [Vibrio fluvialis]|uniref:YaaC family protein n=1 Tax=Vibrio fluvialis TaxID=676 RepID=UPI0015596824|nr:YaaC family protein [Vibrio fluvialis]